MNMVEKLEECYIDDLNDSVLVLYRDVMSLKCRLDKFYSNKTEQNLRDVVYATYSIDRYNVTDDFIRNIDDLVRRFEELEEKSEELKTY